MLFLWTTQEVYQSIAMKLWMDVTQQRRISPPSRKPVSAVELFDTCLMFNSQVCLGPALTSTFGMGRGYRRIGTFILLCQSLYDDILVLLQVSLLTTKLTTNTMFFFPLLWHILKLICQNWCNSHTFCKIKYLSDNLSNTAQLQSDQPGAQTLQIHKQWAVSWTAASCKINFKLFPNL